MFKLYPSPKSHEFDGYRQMLRTEENTKADSLSISPKEALGDDFYIKSVRADEFDFFRTQTIFNLTKSPCQQIKHKLRKDKKKQYTVH